MASHNPSGKPDMMPFPGVHSVRREEASRKCKAITVAHLKKYCSCCLHLHKSCSQIQNVILFSSENELLARSYNSERKIQDCQKICICFISWHLLCKIILSAKIKVMLPILATIGANINTGGMMNSRLVKQNSKNTLPNNKIGFCV